MPSSRTLISDFDQPILRAKSRTSKFVALLGIGICTSSFVCGCGNRFAAYSAVASCTRLTLYQYLLAGLVLPCCFSFDSTIPTARICGIKNLCTVLIGTPVAREISPAVIAESIVVQY